MFNGIDDGDAQQFSDGKHTRCIFFRFCERSEMLIQGKCTMKRREETFDASYQRMTQEREVHNGQGEGERRRDGKEEAGFQPCTTNR